MQEREFRVGRQRRPRSVQWVQRGKWFFEQLDGDGKHITARCDPITRSEMTYRGDRFESGEW